MKTPAFIAAAAAMAAFTTPAMAAEMAVPGSPSASITIMNASLAKDPPPHAPAYGRRAKDRQRIYDSRGRYLEPRRLRRDDRIWRGDDGRYYCKRDNGTTGLIIGAGVGALAGRAIDTDGDRTVGTLLGGALGAVIGREIDRGEVRCR